MSADPEDTLTFPVIAEAPEPLHAVPVMPEPPFPLFPIGDALIASLPGFDILPCGRCGTKFCDTSDAILRRARILSYLVILAGEAGWTADPDYGWCCPACTATLTAPAADWEDGAAEALRAHQDILAAFDRTARSLMDKLGGKWKPRKYRYDEPAPEVLPDFRVAEKMTAAIMPGGILP